MPEKQIRILICDYCEAEIPPADEDAATWSLGEPTPRTSWRLSAARSLGIGSPAPVPTVFICAECRSVVTINRLLELLEEKTKGSPPA